MKKSIKHYNAHRRAEVTIGEVVRQGSHYSWYDVGGTGSANLFDTYEEAADDLRTAYEEAVRTHGEYAVASDAAGYRD